MNQLIEAASALLQYGTDDMIVSFTAQCRGIVSITVTKYKEIEIKDVKHFIMYTYSTTSNEREYNDALKFIKQ